MRSVPFFSEGDIKGALCGITMAFDAAQPEVQDERVTRDRRIWHAAMDAVAAALDIEWRGDTESEG